MVFTVTTNTFTDNVFYLVSPFIIDTMQIVGRQISKYIKFSN